ncbi:reelin-like isoform X1 [Asterias amurensis]|uniref:reelin-like isoform X1 n=1 Tax=Asterias amurensis TaxID=7602 RepID=UPI003AB8CD77
MMGTRLDVIPECTTEEASSLLISMVCGRDALPLHTVSSDLMFVLQIGSTTIDNPSCSVKAILLQYTVNNAINWHLIESHDLVDYQRAQGLSYSLPTRAKGRAVRFRWWQPQHNGPGNDQWAIDNIQLIMF